MCLVVYDLNADSQLNDIDGPIGYNMFAYCNNNPVMYSDSTGHLPFFAISAAIIAAVGAIVGGVKAAKAGKSVWKGALKGAAVGGWDKTIRIICCIRRNRCRVVIYS